MNNKLTEKISFIFVFLILMIVSVNAYPPLPTEFYGNVTDYKLLNGLASPGQIGKIVRTYDNDGILCGSFTIKNEAYYGVLSCRGDDNTSNVDEGGISGETIIFNYNNISASAFGETNFSNGKYHLVNIIIPKIICGDEICMKGIETCGDFNENLESISPHLCFTDCGVCVPINATPPNGTPPNGTPPSGGEGGGGGGGGGAGGAGGGAGGGGGGEQTIVINMSQLNMTPTSCKENWNCSDWGECYINETQIRVCLDNNYCNTTNNKPQEIQECIYFGNCFDGIRNGKETGIDCGGPCRPCPGHEGEPNCFDGIRNCHDGTCEDGTDCGGVCENKCEKPKKIELPIQICNKPTDLFRLDFLLLFILVVIFTIIYVVIEKEREKKIRKDEKLKDIEKARKYLLIEKSIMLFIMFVILILTSTITYYIFFYCSKNFYEFVKFLFPAALIVPILAFLFMKAFEYSEKDRKLKLDKFLNTHYEHLKKMILLQNEYLKDLEVEISNDIYQLSLKGEFKETMKNYPELKTVYRDMIVLYDKYKAQKTAVGIEKELIDSIKTLEENSSFKELKEKHEKVKEIYEKLSTLYNSYEEKQELYKELKEEEDKKGKKLEVK